MTNIENGLVNSNFTKNCGRDSNHMLFGFRSNFDRKTNINLKIKFTMKFNLKLSKLGIFKTLISRLK